MRRSFRSRLRKLLLLGTIIPALCFILVFFVKYYNMNLDSEKTLFNREVVIFENALKDQIKKYEKLLEMSLDFVEDESIVDESIKMAYLNELLNIEGLDYYYYINGDQYYSQFPINKGLNVKLAAFKNLSSKGTYWVSKMGQFKDDYLYFGLTSKELNNTIVIQIHYDSVFSTLESQVENNILFDVIYDEASIYNNYNGRPLDDFNTFWGLHKSDNKTYLKNTGYLKDPDNNFYKIFSYQIFMDISREINFLVKNLYLFSCFLAIYLILMGIIIFIISKKLLRPLNELIDFVANVAEDGVTSAHAVNSMEYQSIFDTFHHMVETTYMNMQTIENQSEIMKEKNKILLDLNQQLNVSMDLVEASTNELMTYEKQSKILVGNIKDLTWIIDVKGRIIFINNIVEDKLGYTPEELLGIKLESILKQDVENEEAIHAIFSEDFDSIDLVFLKKHFDSEEIFSTSTKRIYQNGKLIKIQGVSRDITEERFIQTQLIQKNEISNTLNEISEILTHTEKLEVLLKHIVLRIERLLNPLICTIRLLDGQNRLELKAGIGQFYSLVQEKYLDINKDISGRAIKESKIIIASENIESFYENYHEVHTILEQSKEMIFLPLEYDDNIIGVMSIGLRESITDSQLKILKVFTNQASAAIEKARMYEKLEHNYMNIIKALASTVEAKDAYTEDHSVRVANYSRRIAEELGMSDEEVTYIDIAGLLHDIGKIGVSDLTLTKEGRLTEEEFLEIKKHPLNGGRIVSEMKLHEYIVEGVLLHHKRFDLKGYPDIFIESLPVAARIIGVADAFDAMTSNRSYQRARSFRDAYNELVKHSGTQFCPEIVHVMGTIVNQLEGEIMTIKAV